MLVRGHSHCSVQPDAFSVDVAVLAQMDAKSRDLFDLSGPFRKLDGFDDPVDHRRGNAPQHGRIESPRRDAIHPNPDTREFTRSRQ